MLTKQEIRQLGNREMMEELQKSRRELLKSQFDVRNGTSKEAHVVKNLKRYIARLQTITKEMNVQPVTSKAETTAAAVETKKTPAAAKKSPAPKKTAAKSVKTQAVKSKPKSAKK